jgi:hypothetical protein
MGTIKMHGTNAGIVRSPEGELYFQSRERIITPLDDNAGFATWAHQHTRYFNELFDNLEYQFNATGNEVVQIYGEWCGGNIQKSVGLTKLPKMFVIFGVRVSENAESNNWIDMFEAQKFIRVNKPADIHLNIDFPVFFMDIDFSKPEYQQAALQELTLAVEKDCPVARKFLPDTTDELIGEGLVWEPVQGQDIGFSVRGLRFKTKGEKHSVSKVKVLIPVDIEKVATIDEFVDRTCTENRLKQGLDKLREMGLEQTSQNTGAYLKWVLSDIIKEELDTLSASGLTTKEISSKLSAKARQFYLTSI